MKVRDLILLLMASQGGGLSEKSFLEGNHLAPLFKVKNVFGGLENIKINVLGIEDLDNVGLPTDQIKGYLASFNFNLIMQLKNTKNTIFELKNAIEEITVEKEDMIFQCNISNLMELFNIIDLEIDEFIDSKVRRKRTGSEHEQAAQDATSAMAAYKQKDQGKVNKIYNKVLDIINSCKGFYIFHYLNTLKSICDEASDLNIENILINGFVNFDNARIAFNTMMKICLGVDELGTLRSGTKRQTELELEECKRHKENSAPPLATNNDNDTENESDEEERESEDLGEGEDDLNNDLDLEDQDNDNYDNDFFINYDNEDNDSNVNLEGSFSQDNDNNAVDRTEYLTTHTRDSTTSYLTTYTESITYLTTHTFQDTTTYLSTSTVNIKTVYFITDKRYSTTTTTFFETAEETLTSTPTFYADTYTSTPTKIAKVVTETPTVYDSTITYTPTETADHTVYITPTFTVTASTVTLPGHTVQFTFTARPTTVTPTIYLDTTTIQETLNLPPTTTRVTNTDYIWITDTLGTTTSYISTDIKLKTVSYESTETLLWTTTYLSTETLPVTTSYISTSTDISTTTVTIYESITVRPELTIINNNILPASTEQLKFNTVKELDLNKLLRKIYSQYSENNLPYKKIIEWANRIDKEAHDILNQLKLFKAQEDGILLYNPFANCRGMDRDTTLVKYNNNLFEAKKKYENFVYYIPPQFCDDYCLLLRSSAYAGDAFPPDRLFPAFGYSKTKNHIIIREREFESLDPCLTDKINSDECIYDRVNRDKVTLLLGKLQQKCPENEICSFKDDADNFVAGQMISSQDFKNYYLSNFVRLVDKIEAVSNDQAISQYLITGSFFGANLLIFLMIVLFRLGYRKLQRKKRVKLVRFLSRNNLEAEPLQEMTEFKTQNLSTRQRERKAKAILESLDQISSR